MSNIDKIRELRERTSVSLALCKGALTKSNWDVEEAIIVLQKMGELRKGKRAAKVTNAGLIKSYVHHNGQIGVLVEVNCETDFSARSEPFSEFCENLSLQIASAAPDYLSVNEIPDNVMAKQKEIFLAQVPEKVPENRVEHIINGKLKKWFADVCLVDQKSVMVDKMTIEQMRANLVQQIGENVIVKRFVRWDLCE